MKDYPKRSLFAFKAQVNIPDGSFASLFSSGKLPPSRIQRRVHSVRLLMRHRGQFKRAIKKNQVLNVVNPDMKRLIHNGRKAR